ncbi:hypothetical protein RFI_38835, partial [Reticulomyxa filosa]
NKLGKETISQTWKNYNQIYYDTRIKLFEICATSNLNESEEENELKIIQEMYLHILWNILKYPKHIKYRQINTPALYNYLFQKCHTLGTDFEQILIAMEKNLEITGFKKGNDGNWYYQYNHTQLLHLWDKYYNQHFKIDTKQDIIFQKKCVCYRIKNGKIMKAYLIMNIEQ